MNGPPTEPAIASTPSLDHGCGSVLLALRGVSEGSLDFSRGGRDARYLLSDRSARVRPEFGHREGFDHVWTTESEGRSTHVR
jgi:hypothetical protein